MTANPSNRPIASDNGLKPFLTLWGDVCASGHIHHARLIPPYYTSSLRGKTLSQKAGIRFERNCVKALARGDFTENLCNYLASLGNATVALRLERNETPLLRTVSQITSNNPNKEKIHYLILHNPNFSYSLDNKTKNLCIPDILIIFDSVVNLKQIVANLAPANSTLLQIKSLQKLIIPKLLPANQTIPAKFIICCEVKLGYVDIAFEKLKTLYLPVVAKTFNLPTIPLVIVKNLTSSSPPAKATVAKAITLQIPLLHYFDNKSIL